MKADARPARRAMEPAMHGCTKVPVNATALAFSILVGWISGLFFPGPATAQTARGKVTYLNQAWSPEIATGIFTSRKARQSYATIFSYATMFSLKLQVAGGQELFRGDANSERYGLGSSLSGAVG